MLTHPSGLFFGFTKFRPLGVLDPKIFTHVGTVRPQVGLCPIFLVLSITVFQNLKQTASSRFRTVLHVLWLKLLNLLISHPSSDLCTGSRLMNTLNINSYHSLTKFLQPANLTTYTILSLCSVYRYNSLPSCYPSWIIRIFLITNHQPLFHIRITLPV